MPGLALDSNRPTIELYGLEYQTAVWSDPASRWGDVNTEWGTPATANAWRDVACQVSAFTSSWGADEGTGVLAQSAAGILTLHTYDPAAILDPANPTSPLRKAARIGAPVRLTLPPSGAVLGYGYIDALEYRYEDSAGTVTAADDVATLAQASTAAGFWQPSNALTGFAAAAIASAGQTVPVGPAPGAGDPVIAYRETRSKAVYELVRDAAADALCFAWIDRSTAPPTLRFTPFGYPTDQGLRLGDPPGIMLGALQSVGSAAGVANVVDDATGELARGPSAVGRDQLVSVDRIEPAGPSWAAAILADRARATVALVPGEVYPATLAELVLLAQTRGLDLCRIVLSLEAVDATLRVVGVELMGEAGGLYRARLAVYAPGAPWAYLPPAPAVTAATPSSRVLKVTRDACISKTGAVLPGSNRNQGSGLGPLQVGYLTGDQWSALLGFDPIDYSAIRRLRRVELVFVWDATAPSLPSGALNLEVHRVNAQWSEGRVKSTDTRPVKNGNAVVWPGPAVDAAAVAVPFVTGSGAEVRVDITAIATVNAPVNLGGRGYPDFGYRVNTTTSPPGSVYLAAKETDDDEATSSWCRLELTVEV